MLTTDWLELISRLDQLSHRFRLVMNDHCRRIANLTSEQSHALLLIHAAGGALTISELAMQLERASHSTTVLVDRLEARGLVTRNRKPDHDRRQVWLEVTPEGIAKIEACQASQEELYPLLIEGMTDDELETAAAVVGRLNSRLGGWRE